MALHDVTPHLPPTSLTLLPHILPVSQRPRAGSLQKGDSVRSLLMSRAGAGAGVGAEGHLRLR